jgi:hypothetical protein
MLGLPAKLYKPASMSPHFGYRRNEHNRATKLADQAPKPLL